MVVVAIAGLLLGAYITLEQRKKRLLDRAIIHRRQAMSILYPGGTRFIGPLTARQDFMAYRHMEMFRKYHLAARYPWLPLKPDPPEPE